MLYAAQTGVPSMGLVEAVATTLHERLALHAEALQFLKAAARDPALVAQVAERQARIEAKLKAK